MNNDGIVSIRDVTAVQRLIAELETYDSLSEKAADVDVSGDVTISDATCIQHYLADYPTDYPINEPLDPYASQAQAALNALKTRLAQTKAAADGLPVLIRSYDTEKPQLSMAAYTYDNALAAMAFISSGDKDDALPRFFGQADGIIFKQAVRLELCGIALIFSAYTKPAAPVNALPVLLSAPPCGVLPLSFAVSFRLFPPFAVFLRQRYPCCPYADK